jgi:hypothetical protein
MKRARYSCQGRVFSAGRLIAAIRVLAPEFGQAPRLLRHRLGLEKSSTFEDAIAAAEAFAAAMKLGDVPARRLATIMEQELNILVLMVDPEEGVSGAACRLPNLDAVLINRNEVPGRRHYDLAHELFHILTWDSMPPAHVEDNRTTSKDRVEQLADNFAAALIANGAANIAGIQAARNSVQDFDFDSYCDRDAYYDRDSYCDHYLHDHYLSSFHF